MPRAKSILQSEFPYHVSGRCINKEWFTIPLDVVWEIMSRQLNYVSQVYNAKIHSFVLMSNHFHLLISTPNSNLDKIMASFMRECTRGINNYTGRINQAYGARHFRCVIETDLYFQQVYKYVYRNPVEANLVDKCEKYPFSSLAFLLGQSLATFPVIEDHILFPGVEKTLNWLNEPTEIKDWSSIQKGLKRSKFSLAQIRSSRKSNPLNYRLL